MDSAEPQSDSDDKSDWTMDRSEPSSESVSEVRSEKEVDSSPSSVPSRAADELLASAAVLFAAPSWYCDVKVANREIRVWHFVIENGY